MAVETGDAAADAFDALGSGSGKGKNGGNNGGGSGKGGDDKDKGKDTKDGTTVSISAVVEIKGTVTEVLNSCPAKSVAVGLKTFVTSAATTYKHGTCDTLLKDAVVEVHAVTGADGRLVARDVEFEAADADDDDDVEDDDDSDDDTGRNPHDSLGPYEGTVSSFRGTCPLVTFNLKGMTIVTSMTTTFSGGACGTLRPNVKVIVTRGEGSVGRVVMAEMITITRAPNGTGEAGDDDDDEDDGDDAANVVIRGALQTLGTEACPGVTFTIGTQAVIANAQTEFRNGPCAHLENGTWVEVSGVRQADGKLLASKIQMKEVRLNGLIASADGVCPTRTLVVNSVTVKTFATTTFEMLPCAAFVKDVPVEIRGTEHALGLVKAVRVRPDLD